MLISTKINSPISKFVNFVTKRNVLLALIAMITLAAVAIIITMATTSKVSGTIGTMCLIISLTEML